MNFRSIALIIILTRAGIGLEPSALKKLGFAIICLGFIPCVLEASSVGVAAHYFLALPWSFSFMLGFIVTAISPAVVVPCMLSLQQRSLGVTKGIPTLILAAASFDDILAISGFGVLLGLEFSVGENILLAVLKKPLEILVGLVLGILTGLSLWFLPHKGNPNRVVLRLLLLFSLNVALFFGSVLYHASGAGALGCLAVAFTASCGWRGQGHVVKDLSQAFRYLWFFMEAILFGLIGAEVDLNVIDISLVTWGTSTILIGAGVRLVAAFFAPFTGGFNFKEKLFISIAWVPKGTVQAALGPIILDTVRNKGLSSEFVSYGLSVLAVSVLVILISAPLGAFLMNLTAPRLLVKAKKDSVPQVPQDVPVAELCRFTHL